MTAPRDPDRMIHACIGEGADRLADPVYDAVRAEIETKPQRAVIGPWRVPPMNKIVPIAIGVAAVVAILVIGSQVVRPVAPSGVAGQPVSSATPSPSVAPTTSPASVVAPLPAAGLVKAGTYRMGDGQSSIRITLPDGWEATGATELRKHRDAADELMFTLFRSDINVFADVCKTDVEPPRTGPTSEDLLAALSAQAGTDVSAPEAVTVDGGTGVRLTVSVPAGFDYAGCTDRAAKVWSAIGNGNWLAFAESPDAQAATIYVVDGPAGRVVYGPGIAAAASEADRAELDAMLRSIALEPAP